MKIAIPVDERNIKTKVSQNFGRAPFFLIYDTETLESSYIDNKGASSTGGAGIKAAQTIVDSKAEVLLTPRCGENAADVLKAADIKIYETTMKSTEENIADYINGRLSLLNEIHAGFHGHGRH